MNRRLKNGWPVMVLVAMVLVMLPVVAGAMIVGDTGSLSGSTRTFTVTAKEGRIIMGDGETAYIWGYASATAVNAAICPAGNCVQYPGPTFIVNQGETVVVNLTNSIPTLPGNLPQNTSILFPGQNVTPSGGVAGILTREAAAGGGQVSYTFTAANAGTYTYYSGTNPSLQQEMGLFGTLIVRPNNAGTANCPFPSPANPTAPNKGFAYCFPGAYYDREYLVVSSEIDTAMHRLVEFGQMLQVDITKRHPTAWFVNGRNFPDSVSPDFASWLPAQPYSMLPVMHPLESVLIRLVSGGRDLHPYHTHGQNHSIIARDGRMLKSAPAVVISDMPVSDYTTTTVAGETADMIYGPWTGFKLNFDIYGTSGSHSCNTSTVGCTPATCPAQGLITFLGLNGTQYAPGFDPRTGEWCGDHNKAIPVSLPAPSRTVFGPFYGGTPYLGVPGELPPIDVNTGNFHSYQNPLGGLQFMWHSHAERELTTNNIFIGGLASMALIVPYTVVIP